PRAAEGIRQIRALAERYGPRSVVWRYDPLLISSVTDADFHRATFRRLAAALEGRVDEVCVSFAQIYAKTRRNLAAWARGQGETWEDPALEEKRRLRTELESMAQDHGMLLSVCSQAELGGRAAVCIDAERLADLAGRPLQARQKGNRPGCLCAESRDIGAYDTCPHGCVYCYAVASRARAQARHRAHDPSSEYLLGPTAAAAG
ncbi:MAG: DUF1848 family protein, partial [Alphaproteobacteria bacterium]|nr:DUF1848 family protein [Alphaproteobacteria bacterium]